MEFFERSTSGVSGSLPFLENFYEMHPESDGQDFEVKEVKETRSRAGFMILTSVFQVCLFKSHDYADLLTAELEDFLEKGIGCPIYLRVIGDDVDGFAVAVDRDQKRIWTRKKRMGGLFHCVHGGTEGTSTKRKKLPTRGGGA